MIDAAALLKAYAEINGAISESDMEKAIMAFLAALPRPEAPYDQAIAYRKLVGME